MKIGRKVFVVLLIVGALQLGAAALASGAEAATPTCSTTLGIKVHGQHIVGDYITGIGHTELGWPPAGQVGETVGGDGPVVPGGPGPGFHFPNGFSPGASFCLEQSKSPGAHPGLG
jgi:hypothetical protein